MIAERITTANGVSEENIRTLINSMVDDSNSTIEFRSKAYYNLSALRTSISVEEVIESIRNAEKWQGNQQDSESGLRILLYGISGTGKTAFVEYIADMIDKPLQCIRTSDIMRSKAGATEHNIKVSFRNAAQSGAILLIDEADTLLRSRKDVQYNWEASMTNEFIQQMERFPGILFCNTNLPEFLDTATNRRFHMQIKFESLDTAGIEKLCESYFGRFSFTQRQISEIHASGEVCPGDFGAVFGRLRFADPEKLSTEFIVQELVNTIRAKTADKSSGRKIGF